MAAPAGLLATSVGFFRRILAAVDGCLAAAGGMLVVIGDLLTAVHRLPSASDGLLAA